MIPHGRTAADAATAAKILGVSYGTFKNKRSALRLPPLISRTGARHQLWDYQQLVAALAGEDIPPLPDTAEHPLDLLDAEEARLTIPADRRPTAGAWSTYLKGSSAPAADALVCEAVPHYRRAAVPTLEAARRAPGGAPGRGRTKGAVDKGERRLTAEVHQRAAQRRARVRGLLEQAAAEGVDLLPSRLALELGVSQRHAERLLTEARTA
ncbi:hypothetical protein [Streptacidiphilus carbonis]|uniref:hypothetical protein n=1 Tax=Streptacidiphilus carbonis TaxID=105422 RepID=UPI0005A98B48|nr:hypothetical protein [Streptacidiphilus carbonis]